MLSSNYDSKLMESIMLGLNVFLNQYEFILKRDMENAKTVFLGIRTSIARVHTEKVFSALKASLNLLEMQANLFYPFYSEFSLELIKELLEISQHRNKDLRNAASPALLSVVEQIGFRLMAEEILSVEASSLFVEIIAVFRNLLYNQEVGVVNNISIAVRAFANLASPICHHMGENELNVLVKKLIEFSDSILRKSMEELESFIYLYSNFITAFSRIFSALNVLEDQYCEFARSLMFKVLGIFPTFTSRMRESLSLSLTKLLVVLCNKMQNFEAFISTVGNF